MRRRAVVWRVVVLVGWVAALVGLAALDWDEASWYIAVGPPLTVLVGALINRWWAVLTPLPVSAVWVVVGLVQQSSCTDCERDEWWVVAILAFMLFTGPAIAALAAGVALRRLPRRRPPREQHA
jgi:hypothetical protein